MTRGNILTEEEIARLAALPEKQRDYAVKIYAAREKKKSTAYILWLFFALYYFYLGHPVKNIIFWLLWSCLIGEIWWLIDLFRISDMVDETNEEILGTCIEESITQSKESTRYEQRNHQRTGHSPPERPHAPAERIRPYPLLRKRKEEIHSLHPLDRLRRLLLLSRPSCEEHHLLAAMDLLYRRNLVDHRPLPHLRHGRQEE